MFSNPETSIDQMGLLPGMRVADLGAGTGAYSLPLARAVGGAGKIYAVDVQKDLLSKLKNEANTARLANIEVIAGDIERLSGTHIRAGEVDVAVAANVLFQVPLMARKNFVQEMKRILKKGGRAIVIDWKDSFGGIGPQPSNLLTQYKATELFQGEGFTLDRTISAGDHHYGVIFKKAS